MSVLQSKENNVPSGMSGKTRILIIEDDEANRVSIAEILTAKGYSVSMASNGAAALQLMAKTLFDIALVDYYLPDINGIEIIRKAREMGRSPVPIMITGISSLDVALEGMKLGVHDYMVKSINVEELITSIETILKERSEFQSKKANIAQAMKELNVKDTMAIVDIFNKDEETITMTEKSAFTPRIKAIASEYMRESVRLFRNVFHR